MATMRGAVLYEIGGPLVIEELSVPELAHGQVLVKVMATGLCHKQLEEITGKRGEDPFLPHLLGHEGAGIVQEIGPGVTCVQPGDHVVLGWMKGGGINSETPTYRTGDRTINAGWIATFGELIVVSENRVTPMDPAMPFDAAALLGCAVTTGVGAVRRIAGVTTGSTVAVFGMGGIGLSAVLGAASCRAGMIVAVDISAEKLELARDLGATHTVDAAAGDAVAAVAEIAGAAGVDYGFEAAGNARVMEQAYRATGPQGTTVLMGVPAVEDTICIDPLPLYLGQRLTGCHGGDTVRDEDIPQYVQAYLAGELKLDRLITRRLRLDEINDGFEEMRAKRLIGRALIEF